MLKLGTFPVERVSFLVSLPAGVWLPSSLGRESAFFFCITLLRCAYTMISLILSSPSTCFFKSLEMREGTPTPMPAQACHNRGNFQRFVVLSAIAATSALFIVISCGLDAPNSLPLSRAKKGDR
jgi:hypothetical protein